MEGDRQPDELAEERRPIACLGEAIVDLICERNLAPGDTPGPFVAWPGGALANVAVAVARQGSPAALLGGVGGDHWGDWLARGLESEGVSTRWLATLDSADTPVALVEFDRENEPSFQVYGEHIGPTMAATSDFLETAIGASQAVVIGSNTMVGETEREVTRRAVDLVRSAGRPLLLDPNYRPNRWTDRTIARDFCRELAAAATVVKLNQVELELITGIEEPRRAATDLAGMGPELVVVTAGEGEIITAGAIEETFRPEPVAAVSPLGAGDAFMGGLAAGLAGLGWDFTRAGEALPGAARAAAAVCGHWGAQ
jgi:fructokinase